MVHLAAQCVVFLTGLIVRNMMNITYLIPDTPEREQPMKIDSQVYTFIK
ncbi:hypothetical protein WMO24_15510 [Ruthenibacterium sp. CLA-JM-H11]|uniref:Transposase n=1 Tax=Ruthenibacterium intestinale TaxID=3133163 RepID=A0ABV1GIZ5_9FIRM